MPGRRTSGARDLSSLLHPAAAFAHPLQVVDDGDLTLNEKRAILASWASDACAATATPALRPLLPAGKLVTFDDVMDALRELDERAAHDNQPRPHSRRVLNRRARPGDRAKPLS
jgi:hypothetical protein